jgi:DNA-binding NarL/FixJ family response regulator
MKFKQNNPEISWIALIYSYFDNEILNKFDDKIFITEPTQQIIQKLFRSSNNQNDYTDNKFTELTEREIDILTQLVKGLSNKEIADELNISIHTVISHRKNITEKTGIKSLPGLTIYAISKKIIHLNSNT